MAFKKGQSGNPLGKAKGTKNSKTKEWEVLADSITESHSQNFNKFMGKLWAGSMEDQYKAAQLYLQVLKYFKPKMASIQSTINEPESVSKIIFVDAKRRKD